MADSELLRLFHVLGDSDEFKSDTFFQGSVMHDLFRHFMQPQPTLEGSKAVQDCLDKVWAVAERLSGHAPVFPNVASASPLLPASFAPPCVGGATKDNLLSLTNDLEYVRLAKEDTLNAGNMVLLAIKALQVSVDAIDPVDLHHRIRALAEEISVPWASGDEEDWPDLGAFVIVQFLHTFPAKLDCFMLFLMCVAECILRPLAALASNPVVFESLFPGMKHVVKETMDTMGGPDVTVIAEYDMDIIAQLLPAMKTECEEVHQRVKKGVRYLLFLLLFCHVFIGCDGQCEKWPKEAFDELDELKTSLGLLHGITDRDRKDRAFLYLRNKVDFAMSACIELELMFLSEFLGVVLPENITDYARDNELTIQDAQAEIVINTGLFLALHAAASSPYIKDGNKVFANERWAKARYLAVHQATEADNSIFLVRSSIASMGAYFWLVYCRNSDET